MLVKIITSSLLCFLFSCIVHAQIKSARSIIVKFKTEASLLSPSKELQSAISSISSQNAGSATRIFQKKSNGNIQSITSIDPELAQIIIFPILDGVDVQESANKLQTFSEIAYSEPNYIYHIESAPTPNDSLYDQQWAHRVMRIPEAWQVTQGDSSIHIGFIDLRHSSLLAI